MKKFYLILLFLSGPGICCLMSFAQSSIHHIGEKFGGGIIFYVSENGNHGLIASTADLQDGIPWYNGLTRNAGTFGDGIGSGSENTKIIVSKLLPDDPNGIFAAKICADYRVITNGVTYADWYLPSKYELNLLFQKKDTIGGFLNRNYWSSTEYKTNSVWIQYFGDGRQRISNSESYANVVRPIRAF
jgi:Protein of unknown function (DUF1566)